MSDIGVGSTGVSQPSSEGLQEGTPAVGQEGSTLTDGKIQGSGQTAQTASVFQDQLEPAHNTDVKHAERDPTNPILPLPKVEQFDVALQSFFSGPSIAALVAMNSAILDMIKTLKESTKVDTKIETTQDLEARESSKMAYDITERGVEENLQKATAAAAIGIAMATFQMTMAFAQMGNLMKTQKAANKAEADAVAANNGKDLTPDMKYQARSEAWKKGEMQGQIMSGLSQGVGQIGNTIADLLKVQGQAAQTLAQAQAELYKDTGQAHSKTAQNAAEDRRKAQDMIFQAIDALQQAHEKVAQALSQIG